MTSIRVRRGLAWLAGGLIGSGAALAADPPRLADSELKPLRARWLGALEAFQVPGVALVVVRGDEVIALDAFGVRDIESKAPVTPDTMFYIASCTKPFNALAAVALAEDGKLDLDAPVQRVLPQFGLADADLTARLTPRDLMCHRYGIESSGIVFNDAYTGEITDERYFRLLRSATVRGQVSYTNVHFTLLGRVLQAASGAGDWRDLLDERILRPAGMTRTTGYADRMYRDADVALPHVHADGRWQISPVRKTDRTMHAAGGLGASASDLGRWLRLHLNQGRIDGRQVVSPAGMEQMLASQSQLPAPRGRIRVESEFALGWMKGTFRGHGPYYSHGGGYVGAAAYVAFMPQEKIGLAVMANTDAVGSGLVDIIAVDVFDHLLNITPEDDLLPSYQQRAAEYLARPAQRPGGVNPAAEGARSVAASAYAGAYAHDDFGTLQVALTQGELSARLGDLKLALVSNGTADAFTAVAPTMELEGRFVVENGRVAAVVLDREDGQLRFERR